MPAIKKEIIGFLRYVARHRIVLLIFLGIMLFLIITSFIPKFPTFDELFLIVKQFYAQWGLLTIFLASIIEGILFVNWYFPGSFIVLIGVFLSREGIVSFPLVILISFFGFSLAFIFDYFIGRYGIHRLFPKQMKKPIEKAKKSLERREISTFFIWYVHPQLGNFVATGAGILRYDFRKFLILNSLASMMWLFIWGSLGYVTGPVMIRIVSDYFIHIALFSLFVWLVFGYVRERKRVDI